MMLTKNSIPFAEVCTSKLEFVAFTNRLFSEARKSKLNALNDGTFFRPLLRSEEKALSNICHCRSTDWSKLRLWIPKDMVPQDDYSRWLERNVSFNTFEGLVAINVGCQLNGNLQDATLPPAGIHFNTLISNCIIEKNCRVYRNNVLKDTYIGANASILGNGQLVHSPNASNYGMLKLSVGPESGGGREVFVTLESTMIDICCQLKMNHKEGKEMPTSPIPLSPYNMIGNNCIFRDNPTARDIFLLPTSKIEATNNIESVTLMPGASIGYGASAKNASLQWNTFIHQSHVENVLLMEQAKVGPNSIVQDSILGPDVHVSAGEVHASVLGPNTNAHHQSLLISVLWPLGRGNVGYGANVGSNHTGRLPDQEVVAAEGTFWGLSSVIKFPVNIAAPYSIVAAGTTLVPQHISMPFSLLVEQHQECYILPAWVLQSSPYTISRSEIKFSTRRKAKRHEWYTGWKIIRPSTIDLMMTSRQILEASNGSSEYRNIPGAGKAILSEKSRRVGIAAYSACIQRYALLGLLQYCQENLENITANNILESNRESEYLLPVIDLTEPRWPVLPWEEEPNYLWSHQKAVLFREFPSRKVAELLNKLLELEKDYAQRVQRSKNRDDTRGAQIIPGYRDSHVHADDDEVVKSVIEFSLSVEKNVQNVLLILGRKHSRL
mmetsp:Transcript_6579/g.7179  ORF Transcript_6579/g.7179 Transcript_6579/m.7179 type:complete len:665 (-) Transcript_6579:74-2068(-)